MYTKRNSYVRRRRATGRKRVYTRRQPRKYRLRANRLRMPFARPKSQRLKLKYCETDQSISVAALSVSNYTYQTSLFDPYTPAGGHQPMYFDQWSAIYQGYRVFGIGYRIQLTRLNDSAGSLTLLVRHSPSSTADTSSVTARERKNVRYVPVAAGTTRTITGYMSLARTLGVPKKSIYDNIYSATTSANPSSMAYLLIQTFNDTGAALSGMLAIQLMFYCEMYFPVDVTAS